MYKLVLIHEVLPGRLADMVAWMKKQDAERVKQDPAYKPFKRYITVFGSAHQVTIEVEVEKLSEEPLVYAEMALDGGQGEFLGFITPGTTAIHLLKELDLS